MPDPGIDQLSTEEINQRFGFVPLDAPAPKGNSETTDAINKRFGFIPLPKEQPAESWVQQAKADYENKLTPGVSPAYAARMDPEEKRRQADAMFGELLSRPSLPQQDSTDLLMHPFKSIGGELANLVPSSEEYRNQYAVPGSLLSTEAGSTIMHAAAKVGAGIFDFMKSPAGIATAGIGSLGAVARQLIGVAFGADAVHQFPDQYKQAVERAHEGDVDGTVEALAGIGVGTLMLAHGVHAGKQLRTDTIVNRIKAADAARMAEAGPSIAERYGQPPPVMADGQPVTPTGAPTGTPSVTPTPESAPFNEKSQAANEQLQAKFDQSRAALQAAVADARKNGASPEFRVLFSGIDPALAGTTPEKVAAYAESLGVPWEAPKASVPESRPPVESPPISAPPVAAEPIAPTAPAVVSEPLTRQPAPAVEPPTPAPNASISVVEPARLLQREPPQAGETGGERQRVEPSVQGNEAAPTSAEAGAGVAGADTVGPRVEAAPSPVAPILSAIEQAQAAIDAPQNSTAAVVRKRAAKKQIVALKEELKKAEVETSPLQMEWAALKDANPSGVIAVRLGDFYEFFNTDADVASHELGVSLTKRRNMKMAGVPYHAAEQYFQKLQSEGFDVHVVDVVNGQRQVVESLPQTKFIAPGSNASPARSPFVSTKIETPASAEAKAEEHVQNVAATEGKRSAKEIKTELVARIQAELDALLKETGMPTDLAKLAKGEGSITVDIPGDGTFTINRTGQALLDVLKRAEAIKTTPDKAHVIKMDTLSASQKREAQAQRNTEIVATVRRTYPSDAVAIERLSDQLARANELGLDDAQKATIEMVLNTLRKDAATTHPSGVRFRSAPSTDPIEARAAHVADTQAAVDAISAEFPGAPPVTVVDTMADLPENIRKGMRPGETVSGVWDRGRVWIVAQFATAESLARTYWHEVVGHHGVRAVLGERATEFFENVARSFPERAKPGLSLAEAGEEILATTSEQKIASLGILDSLIAPARRLLRRIAQAFGQDLKVSDAEIRELLYRSFKTIKSGEMLGSVLRDGAPQEVRFSSQSKQVNTARSRQEELDLKGAIDRELKLSGRANVLGTAAALITPEVQVARQKYASVLADSKIVIPPGASEADLRALAAAHGVPVGASSKPSEIASGLRAARDSAEVTVKVLKSQFGDVFDAVVKAEDQLAERIQTYREAQADPGISPERKESITRDAVHAVVELEQFSKVFNERFAKVQDRLAARAKQLLEEELPAARLQSSLGNTAIRQFTKIVGEVLRLQANRGELDGLNALRGSPTAYTSVLRFMVEHRLTDIPEGMTGAELRVRIKDAADALRREEPWNTTVGASLETIGQMTDWMVKYKPVRDFVRNEAPDIINALADEHPAAMTDAFKKAKARIATALAEATRTRDYSKLPNEVTRAIDAAGQQRAAASRKLAALTSELRRTISTLDGLHQAKDIVDSTIQSPEYRDLGTRIFHDADVSNIETGLTNNGSFRFGAIPGSKFAATDKDPGGLTMPLNDGRKITGEKNLAKVKAWMDAARKYLTNRDAPEWNALTAAGLERVLRNQEYYTGVVFDPSLKALQPGILGRAASLKLFAMTQIARYNFRWVRGVAAKLAEAAYTRWSEAARLRDSLDSRYATSVDRVLLAALNSHSDLGKNPKLYKEMILDPLSASRQRFDDVNRLSVGERIGNGYTITAEDMALLNLERQYMRELNDAVGSKSKLATVARQPLEITEDSIVRRRLETGPSTMDRSAHTLLSWASEWMGASVEDRIALINANAKKLIYGYLASPREVDLKHRFPFAEEMTRILNQAKRNELIGPDGELTDHVHNFDHLAERVTDEYNKTHEEPITVDQAAQGLLNDIGSLLEGTQDPTDLNIQATRVMNDVTGGRNAFTFARGHQIVPAGWYDYGFTTPGERVRLSAQAMVPFMNAAEQSLEALTKSLNGEYERMKVELAAGKDLTNMARRNEIAYDMGQIQKAQYMMRNVQNYLIQERVNLHIEDPSLLSKAAGLASDAAIGTTLAKLPVQIANWHGGSYFSLMHDIHSGTGIVGSAKNLLGKLTFGRTFDSGLHLLTQDAPLVARPLRWMLKTGAKTPLLNLIAEPMLRSAEEYNALVQEANTAGLGRFQGDTIEAVKLMGKFAETGGTPAEPTPGIGRGGKLANRAITAVPMGTRLAASVVNWVDLHNNVFALQEAQRYRRAYEAAAQRYGKQAVEIMDASRTRVDATGTIRVGTGENTSAVRWPDSLLTTKMLDIPITTAEKAATFQREFFQRELGVSLDAAMLDFYNRFKAAEAQETAAGAPKGSITGNVRFLTEEEFNSMKSAFVQDFNMGAKKNRLMFARTGSLQQAMSTFWGWTSNAFHAFASTLDHLNTEGVAKGTIKALPAFALVAVVTGLLGAASNELRKKAFQLAGKEPPVPTIGDAQDAKAAAKAIVTGYASTVPVIGSLINMAMQQQSKTGFDLNSQFFMLNVATQGLKAIRDTVLQAAYGTYNPQPLLRFADQFLPINVSRFLPPTAGLQDISNARALIAQGATGEGLDALIRKPGSGGTDVGPTTGPLGLWANAVARGDTAGAAQYEQNAIQAYLAANPSATEDAARRSVHNAELRRNPLSVLTNATPEDKERILSRLSPENRAQVEGLTNAFQTAAGGSSRGSGAFRGGGRSLGGGRSSGRSGRVSGLRQRAIRGIRVRGVRRLERV